MDGFTNSYLIFLNASQKLPGTDLLPDSVKQLPTTYCEFKENCSVAEVNLFLWHGVKDKFRVTYCSSCKSLPLNLIEMGFFPLSPYSPKNAVHFGFCEVTVRLRNTFSGSGEKIAEFRRDQNPTSTVNAP